MKKLLNISLLTLVALASLSLASCKNEVDSIFDDDAVARLAKAQAEYVDILTSGSGRWQLQYYANTKEPGYVYVMTFSKDGSVVISGMNKWIGYVEGAGSLGGGVATYGSEKSMWDVITDNGPVLTFNTYNRYFHLFADPYDVPNDGEGSGLDGTSSGDNEAGYGHEGDYEFDIMKYSGDTLYLAGKKYNLNMIMVRINDADYPGDEVYMNEVTAMADSFFNEKIPHAYIELPNDVRWVVKDGSTSILKMFREDADEISTAEYHNVIITHDGLSFMEPISLDGYVIQNFILQPDGSLLCRDDMQTKMRADDLSAIFTNPRFPAWRLDPNDMGGRFAELYNQLTAELRAYQTRILQFVEISYPIDGDSFIIKFNVKKGTARYNPTYYLTLEPNGPNQMKVTVAPQGNKNAEDYAEKVPSLRAFVEEMAGVVDLGTKSVLSPTYITIANPNHSGSYTGWVLQ